MDVTSKITCVAIDDEPLALGLIAGYINQTPFLELLGQFDNPIDAMEFIDDNPVQLLFLDIQMPDLNGISFAKVLDSKYKIIFTTAFEEFALDGFRVEALDYLLKPISYEVFLKSANRAKKYYDLLSSNKNSLNNSPVTTYNKYILVKSDSQFKRIDYDNILYFEGLKDYIKLYTKNSKTPILFHATMKSVEEKLPDDRFMRIHRSYIVNLENIISIERNRIIYGNKLIPISEKYKEGFDEFVKNKFL
jgi:DNA-binding LytR/AlgR family response regulator